ncbi:MAG: N-acetylmuramoyl-L-alanine amidase, partial [uncultured bacterium (gcode 4)]
MKKFTILTVIFFLFYIFAPYWNTIEFSKEYTFENEQYSELLKLSPVFKKETSLSDLPLNISWYKTNLQSNFSKPKDTFVFKIKKIDWLENNDVLIYLLDNDKKIRIQIDNDWDERKLKDEYIYTEPVFLDSKNELNYELESKKDISWADLTVIWIDTKSFNEKMEISINPQNTNADTNIVSRKEWWADETLRYKDNTFWVNYYKKQTENQTPKTPAQIKAEQKIIDIRKHLATNFPEQDNPVEKITQENWHDLVWPIEKTKKVEKIIIHHTAWVYDASRDDASIIRWIYASHAIANWWWDIWYNYLIWRDWRIYEWRAWWDYNVGAHALWNNKSTVWVSALWNFQVNMLPALQRSWIEESIQYLAKKYWINLNNKSTWH